MNKLIVGTRSSNLAITQSNIIIKKLKEVNPSIDFIIKKIQTKGDILLDQDLNKVLDKGFFVSEIQNELIKKSIDIAIHSLKDLPTRSTRGWSYGASVVDPRTWHSLPLHNVKLKYVYKI